MGFCRSRCAWAGLDGSQQIMVGLGRSWWVLAGLGRFVCVSGASVGLGVLVDLNIYQELGKRILKFSVRGMSRMSSKQKK